MVPQVKDILDVLEKLAPAVLAEKWDNPGLQVGSLTQKTRKILVALDPTLSALKEASHCKAQLLVTHHPLLFKPISCFDIETYPSRVISEALRKRISIIAAHTNLDMAEGGINDQLAEIFGLKEISVLQKQNMPEIWNAGLGRIGLFPKPMPLHEVAGIVMKTLELQQVRILGDRNRKINRVAVIGGSGGSMVSLASRQCADLLITGDISHHNALEAENLGLALIDAGHFHTEKAALIRFTSQFITHLRQSQWDVVVEVYRDEKAPMAFV